MVSLSSGCLSSFLLLFLPLFFFLAYFSYHMRANTECPLYTRVLVDSCMHAWIINTHVMLKGSRSILRACQKITLANESRELILYYVWELGCKMRHPSQNSLARKLLSLLYFLKITIFSDLKCRLCGFDSGTQDANFPDLVFHPGFATF